MIVSAIVHLTGGVNSYFSSLYALPIIAASAIQSWRGGMMVGMLSSLLYAGVALAQYFGTPASPVVVVAQDLPPLRVALFTVGLNMLRVLRRRGADRLSRRRAAPRRRAAAARVERAGGRAGVQPARRRQPDERAGDDRHVRARS